MLFVAMFEKLYIVCTSRSVANSWPDFSARQAKLRTQGNEFRLMKNLVIES
jgi:hypothetical protein